MWCQRTLQGVLLTFEDLIQYRRVATLVDGSFDPFHLGHLKYFHVARSFGSPLIVNICPDSETAKKHPVLIPAAERAQILNNLWIVNYVHVSERPTVEVLQQLQPRVYVKGDDWKDRLPEDQIAACAQQGTTIAYTKTLSHSSTALLRQFQPDVDAFERLVQSQKPAETPWTPVTDYSFEARTAIEGKHPELIRDVFRPERVWDVGCGPQAHLVRLLRDLGVPAMGFDAQAPSSLQQWQTQWRHCMKQDLLADDTPDLSPADLVICREMLEHLSVRQIPAAVRNLCALSSKYVYLTTRFTQARHFLDFATQDGLDPTHISIMPQDWLRHLFVLEGFRRRADLEARMDWQQKGRVLVYERAT